MDSKKFHAKKVDTFQMRAIGRTVWAGLYEFEMNLIITKWLLVYVLENKDNFHVGHFLSLSVFFWYWVQCPRKVGKKLKAVKG